MRFSLVLPCYNPPANWQQNIVNSVREIENQTGEGVELIIVNDGSKGISEDDFDLIKNEFINSKIIHHPENKGKGSALRTGVAESTEDCIIFTDIDFPYTLKSFLSIHAELRKGTDVALGHRGKNYYKNTPTSRKIISKTLRFVLKTFLRIPTDDSQCGIKGFNGKGREVFLQTKIERFLFDLEFIKLASKKKLNIKTLDVDLREGIVFSKVNTKVLLKEGWNFLKILFR